MPLQQPCLPATGHSIVFIPVILLSRYSLAREILESIPESFPEEMCVIISENIPSNEAIFEQTNGYRIPDCLIIELPATQCDAKTILTTTLVMLKEIIDSID